MTPDLSLLHATFHAGDAAVAVRATWLARAAHPERVEHLFSMDADDELSLAATAGLRRVVNPPIETVSAVRNWNAAAMSASGRVLLVIADDLTPSDGWDDDLRRTVQRADPERVAWVVMAKELGGERFWLGGDNALIRHPIVSRAYFRRFGLFDPAFHGIGCDNDFTFTAFRRSVVLEAPGLTYAHQNPSDVASVPATTSHTRMQDEAEWAHSRALRAEKWPAWRRKLIGRYAVPHGIPVPRRPVALAAWHGWCSARKVARGGRDLVGR